MSIRLNETHTIAVSGDERFFRYSTYLKQRYGRKVYRVAVDAGFTCPHRVGGGKGCTFCDEDGSRAVYQRDPGAHGEQYDRRTGGLQPARLEAIRSQIEEGARFLWHRYGADTYILYFQAFSNTFAPLPVLRGVYDYALSCAAFKELIVSTRPDCITPAHAQLLGSYRNDGLEVWAELGLQSSHNATLQRINRGHSLKRFEQAFEHLRRQGIKVTVHLIFGLPGEGREEIMDTVRYVAGLRPEGLKIHDLHVARDTELAREYMRGELTVASSRRHLEYVAEALRYLPPETVIQRITCDTADPKRLAPLYIIPKGDFYSLLDKKLAKENIRQGDRFGG